MADKDNELNIDYMDDGLDELDKLLDEDPFEEETEELDTNDRQPITKILKDTKKVLKEEMSVNNLANRVKESLVDSLPNELGDTLDTTISSISEIKDTVNESLKPLKEVLNKSYGDKLDSLKEKYSEDSMLGKLISKVRSALDVEEDNGFSYTKTETPEDIAKNKVESLFSNIQAQQLETNNNIEKMTLSSNNKIVNFLSTVTSTYYKKSLELQFQSVFYLSKIYDLFKTDLPAKGKQLEAIVKNTALPDMVKVKNKEYLEHKIKSELSGNIYNRVTGSQFVKNLTENTKNLLTEKIGTLTGALQQSVETKEMLRENAEMMGMTQQQMYLQMGLSPVLDTATKKAVSGIGSIAGRTKIGAKLYDKISALTSNPSTVLEKTADKLASKEGALAGFTSDILRTISYSLDSTKNNISLTTSKPDEPAIFDNKAHKAITSVIPTFLSKILNEITSIRAHFGIKKFRDELVYDYDKNKFTTTKRLKREFMKYTKDASKYALQSLDYSKDTIFKAFDINKDLTDKDKKELLKGLTEYLKEGKSSNLRLMREEGLLDKIKDEETKNKIEKVLKHYEENINYETNKINDEVKSKLENITQSIDTNAMAIGIAAKRLSELGRTDLLEELGLITDDGNTIETNRLLDMVSKHTKLGLNKIDLNNINFKQEENEPKTVNELLNQKFENIKKTIIEKPKKFIKTKFSKENIKEKTNNFIEDAKRNIPKEIKTVKENIEGVADNKEDKIKPNIEERKILSHIEAIKEKAKEVSHNSEPLNTKIENLKSDIKNEITEHKKKSELKEAIKDISDTHGDKIKNDVLNKFNKLTNVTKIPNTESKQHNKNTEEHIENETVIKKPNIKSNVEENKEKIIKSIKPKVETVEIKVEDLDIKKAEDNLSKFRDEGIFDKLTSKASSIGSKLSALFNSMTNKSKNVSVEDVLANTEKLIKDGKLEEAIETLLAGKPMPTNKEEAAKLYTTVINTLDPTGNLLKEMNKDGEFLDKMSKLHSSAIVKVQEGMLDTTAKTKELFGNLHNKFTLQFSDRFKKFTKDILNSFKSTGRIFIDNFKLIGKEGKELFFKDGKFKLPTVKELVKFGGKTFFGTAVTTGKATRELYGNLYKAGKDLVGLRKDGILKNNEIKETKKEIPKEKIELDKDNVGQVDISKIGKLKNFYKGKLNTVKNKIKGIVTETSGEEKTIEKKIDKLTKTTDNLVKEIKNKTKETTNRKINPFDKDGDGDRDGNWKDRLNLFKKKDKTDTGINITNKIKEKDNGYMKWILPLVALIGGKFKSIISGTGKLLLKGLKTIFWEPIKWLGSKLLSGITSLGNFIISGVGNTLSGLKNLVMKIPGVSGAVNMVKNVATKSVDFVKNIGSRTTAVIKSVGSKIANTKIGKAVGNTVSKLSKTGLVNKIKNFLSILKKRVIKKLGVKAGAKLVGKIAARFVPFAGWALLAYDAAKIGYYMLHDKLDFKSAVSKQILGFDIFKDDEPAVDPETGEPIKPDEELVKKEEEKAEKNADKKQTNKKTTTSKLEKQKENISKNIKLNNKPTTKKLDPKFISDVKIIKEAVDKYYTTGNTDDLSAIASKVTTEKGKNLLNRIITMVDTLGIDGKDTINGILKEYLPKEINKNNMNINKTDLTDINKRPISQPKPMVQQNPVINTTNINVDTKDLAKHSEKTTKILERSVSVQDEMLNVLKGIYTLQKAMLTTNDNPKDVIKNTDKNVKNKKENKVMDAPISHPVTANAHQF